MAKTAKISVALATGILLFAAAGARAVPLSTLFGGGTIEALNLRFFDWGIETNSGVDPANIEVTTLTGDPLNPGLFFDAANELTLSSPGSITFEFNFKVEDKGGNAVIKDNSLSFAASASTTNSGETADAEIKEDVSDTTGGRLGSLIGTKTVFVKSLTSDNGTATDSQFSDSLLFAPRSVLFIEKRINLSANTGDATAQIDSFTQNFSQVPEPGSLLLLGAGLAGLGLARRHRKV